MRKGYQKVSAREPNAEVAKSIVNISHVVISTIDVNNAFNIIIFVSVKNTFLIGVEVTEADEHGEPYQHGAAGVTNTMFVLFNEFGLNGVHLGK